MTLNRVGMVVAVAPPTSVRTVGAVDDDDVAAAALASLDIAVVAPTRMTTMPLMPRPQIFSTTLSTFAMLWRQ